MQYQFSTVIERDEDGYFAYCPELQGCYTQGRTYEEALDNLQDAIRLHLTDRATADEIVPKNQFVSVAMVTVAV